MKKTLFLFRLFALVATLTCALGASADVNNFYYNGIYYDLYDDAPVHFEWNSETFAAVSSGPSNFHYSGSVTISSSVYYNGKTYPVKAVGVSAFSQCTGLTSVTIPNSMESIYAGAFQDCTGLTSLTLPASVTHIGYYAFNGCTGLTSVTCLGTTPPVFYDTDFTLEDLDPFSEVTYTRATLYVPRGSKSAYQETGYWMFWYKFRNIVEFNGEGSYEYFYKDGIYYYIGLEGTSGAVVTHGAVEYRGSVNIPSSVTHGGETYPVTGIGREAFSGCDGLTSVTIPNSVTIILDDAFNGCDGLTNVTIPNSVGRIFLGAFANCSNLTSVTLGSSVSNIDDFVFYGCPNLNSITCLANTPPDFSNYQMEPIESPFDEATYSRATLYVPHDIKNAYEAADWWKKFRNIQELHYNFDYNGIYYRINLFDVRTVRVTYRPGGAKYSGSVTIPSSVPFDGQNYTVDCTDVDAFAGCTNLTSVTLPNTITVICNGTFSGCSSLRSITIPNSLEDIGPNIFKGCTNLSSVTLPPSLRKITDSMFENCRSLTSVTIPDEVTSIGNYAFYGCSGLTNITIPAAVTKIEPYTFYGCSGLTSVTIPNSVTTIGDGAFYYCTSLTSVTIPNSLTVIKEGTFQNCTSLASVTIGSSVTSIQDRAFAGCTVLRDVKCKASTPPTMAAKTVFDNALYTDLTNMSALTVPMGCRSAYESANWWKDFKVIMEETYDFVVNGFYYRITGINTVELTTKSEMGKTYSGNVTVPGSVTYGGKTYTVTGIGRQCFAWCNLTSLTLPSTITYIGQNAFSMCSGFGSLTLPSSLTEIGAYAFSLCGDLTSLVIPNSVTYIGNYAFNYCRNMTSLTLPSNLINLGKGAFNECSGLTSLTIPNEVTIIQGETFKGCSSLTSVTLGDNVNKIYYDAFNGCSALTSVTIPATVTSIGSDAFNGCTSLTSVNCLAITPPTIHSSTFTSNHYSTVTLTVPGAFLSAYQAADGWKNFSTIRKTDYDIVVNGLYYYITGDNTVSICHGPSANNYAGNIIIPAMVTYGGTTYQVTGIYDDTFRGWGNFANNDLTLVSIPYTVKTIGNGAFMFCKELGPIVVLPSAVVTIGYQAFQGCEKLQSVTLGEGMKFIDFDAFDQCPALTSITCLAVEPPEIYGESFSYNHSRATLFVPKTSLNVYRTAWSWEQFTSIQSHLDDALNTNGGNVEFTSMGNCPWVDMYDNGRVYAMSGNMGVNSSVSTLMTTVTLAHDGSVTFAYKAWGEGDSPVYDACIFTVDGTQKFCYGAKQNNWINYTVQLSAGTHTLMWTYDKDGSVNPEGDYFAIDNVTFTGLLAPGDVDGDGQVSIADVTALIDLILSGDTAPAVADVDGNGSVNIADVTALIDSLFGD